MILTEIYQALIYIIFSLLSPIITSGGGLLVSNALTFTGVSLIVAAGMTSTYFLVNGLIVVGTFWKDIVWYEVRKILPLASLGSILGALFLTQISPVILLTFMLYFALSFLYEGVFNQKKIKKETKLSVWFMSLLSGFLAGTILPGGGLRNSYLLARGHTIPEVHGTTNFIGVICWSLKIVLLFEASVLSGENFKAILIAVPFLFISNFLLRKKLLQLPKALSLKISIFAMALFSAYAATALFKILV